MKEQAKSARQIEYGENFGERYLPRPEFTQVVRIVTSALEEFKAQSFSPTKIKSKKLGFFQNLAIKAAVLVPAVSYLACAGGDENREPTYTSTPDIPPTPTQTIEPTETSTPTITPTPEPTSTPTPEPTSTPNPADSALCLPEDLKEGEELYVEPSIGVKKRDFPALESSYQGGSPFNTKLSVECERNIGDMVWFRVSDGSVSFWIPQMWTSDNPAPTPPPVVEEETPEFQPPPPITPGEGNKIVLTFDDSDGGGTIVSGILDTLGKYGAKAIFFPTGSWAAGSGSPYVQRMLAEGHLVCNHTQDHADLSLLSPGGIKEQILGGAGVGSCNLLRPPYGNGCPFSASYNYVSSVAAELGYEIYCWSIDPRDWAGTSVEYITETILNNASPGAIAVLHMHAANTLAALPAVITSLQDAGYEVSW